MPRSAEALDAMGEEVQGSIEIALVCGGGTATPIESFCDLRSVLTPAEPQLGPPTAADFPGAAPPSLRPVWEEACAKLSAAQSEAGCTVGELLAYLYHRFGRECGVVGRALHEARIAWGTYRDSSGYHCNAHANNLVLRRPAPDGGAEAFLMPCDFDMAFTEESCSFGRGEERDREIFAQYLEQEYQVRASALPPPPSPRSVSSRMRASCIALSVLDGGSAWL